MANLGLWSPIDFEKENSIPIQERFNKYFLYKEGELYWKLKPSKTRLAGSRAGFDYHTERSVKLLGVVYRVAYVVWVMHHGPVPMERHIEHFPDTSLYNCNIENLRLSLDIYPPNTHRHINCKGDVILRHNTGGSRNSADMYRCEKCKQLLPLSNFKKTPESPKGHSRYCLKCLLAGETLRSSNMKAFYRKRRSETRETVAKIGKHTCSSCLNTLPISAFFKNSKNMSGYMYYCKKCQLSYQAPHILFAKARSERRREAVREALAARIKARRKKCTTCKIEKSFNEFSSSSRSKDGYTNRCRDCCNQYSRTRSANLVDGYIRESISNKLKCNTKSVPTEMIPLFRSLLVAKRTCREIINQRQGHYDNRS
jgi:hypothetical protein